MAACYAKELALFYYVPALWDYSWAWHWGIHLWSILTVWLSSLSSQHSRHTLLVCLHTVVVSITINLYRGKLTNTSLIIGFSRSKSYLKTSWPWLMESTPTRVGFFSHFVERKGTSITKIIKTKCNTLAFWDGISLLSLHDGGLKHSIFFLLSKVGYGP